MRYLYLLILLSSYAMAQNGDMHNKGEVYVFPNTLVSVKSNFFNEETATFVNDGEVYLHGSLKNDGVLDFIDVSGLAVFTGSKLQKIEGDEPFYFNNILFQNTSEAAPFQLYNEINAYGLVNFQNGIVDSDNYGGAFIFRESANHTNTSDLSHVDGTVEKEGDEDFIFPIGDGGYYRFAGVSSLGTSNHYKAKYFLENSNFQYSHNLRSDIVTQINNKEYWIIEPSANPDEDIMISLSWREETTPEEVIAAPQEGNIHIVRWDEEANMWIDEGGVVSTNDNTVSTAVNKYGVFTLARVKGDDILPCEIVVYNAVTPNNDGINDYFRIETTDSSCAQNLSVQIFNRWGVKVFESDNYGVGGNVFRGYSEGRVTVNGDKQLPSGTYFYVLNYDYDTNNGIKRHKQAGYLYLSGN